ncbi:MAG: hypothetical protein IPL83_14705 [Bdellovibrionales bacterium]|nr:hypothetical protein [Bdellovibrionales bacterium]
MPSQVRTVLGRTLLSFAISILTIAVFVGCGGKSKSGSPAPAPAPTPTPAGTCAAGQIWSPQHNACLQQCAQAGYGIDPATNQCVYVQGGVPGNNSSFSNLWGGRMIITDHGLYRDFLRDYARICDPYIGWNWGSYSCDSWDSVGSFSLVSIGTSLPTYGAATIYAYNDYSPGYYVPISINGNFEPINDNTGFELRRTGYGGTPSYNDILSVQADPGKLTDSTLYIYLSYNGKDFARIEAKK